MNDLRFLTLLLVGLLVLMLVALVLVGTVMAKTLLQPTKLLQKQVLSLQRENQKLRNQFLAQDVPSLAALNSVTVEDSPDSLTEHNLANDVYAEEQAFTEVSDDFAAQGWGIMPFKVGADNKPVVMEE